MLRKKSFVFVNDSAWTRILIFEHLFPGNVWISDQASEPVSQDPASLARRQVRIRIRPAERDRCREQGGCQLTLVHQR
jgi:hypothetical protein